MLRLENEHHATCRRERDDYDLHRGHHVDEGHSARDPTVSEQIRITWSARVSRSHTDPRRATSSAHRSWRRSTTSLRGSRDLLTSIEDQQTPGNTGLIWLSFSPPPCSPSGRAAVLDTDFRGNRRFRTLMVALSGLTPMTWKGRQTASDESAHAQSPYVRVRVRARGSPGVSDCSPASRGGSIAGRSTTRTAGDNLRRPPASGATWR